MSTLDFDTFTRKFEEAVRQHDVTWEAIGFLAPNGKVHPFGTDTKVISTVFEAIAAPIIFELAAEHGYEVEGALQTVYPDFTLSPLGFTLSTPQGTPGRIAIDIKTTYRTTTARGTCGPIKFTLGSYTSFLRSPGARKNITYPYAEYSDHWVIGFLYTRVPGISAKVYQSLDSSELRCPYTDVEYFVQHKYKIAGTRPGSGNTTNIGSFISNDINEFKLGRGPFAPHGKEVCDDFWRHYTQKAADRTYSNLDSFLTWFKSRSQS